MTKDTYLKKADVEKLFDDRIEECKQALKELKDLGFNNGAMADNIVAYMIEAAGFKGRIQELTPYELEASDEELKTGS